MGAGGFFDVRSLPETIVQLVAMFGDSVPEALAALKTTANLPHQGLTPVVYSSTVSPDQTAAFALLLPRGAIEDAIVLVASLQP